MKMRKYDIRIDLKESDESEWEMIALLFPRNLYWNNEVLEGLLSLHGFGNNVCTNIVDIDINNDEYSGEFTCDINGCESMIRVTYRKIKE